MRNCSDCFFSTVCIPSSFDRFDNDEETLLSLAVRLMPPRPIDIRLLADIERRMRCRQIIKYSAQCLPALHAVQTRQATSRGPLTEEQMHAPTQGYVDAMAVIQQHQGNANIWNGPWKPG